MNIHLARTTFCWLPPDSLRTPASTLGVLMRRLLRYPSVASYSLALLTTCPVDIFDSFAETMAPLMSSIRLSPSALRSSLT